MPEFWKSSGHHLVTRNEAGWLEVTPDLIRAYLTRPEIHPIEESCGAEVATFEALMEDPFTAIPAERLEQFEDRDTADNYRMVLRFRDHLALNGTLEGAYLAMMQAGAITVPPVFVDQLVHMILAGMLRDMTDPMRLRAAELFFRVQSVTTTDGRVMLGDQEIIEMNSGTNRLGTIGQLLAEAGTPARQIELDVLDDDNSALYWQRSDRFDTVIDMRFGQPANYALARVIEAWIRHFHGLETRIEPVRAIRDEAWRWHIGLDRDATALLNALYQGHELPDADVSRLLALYRMEIVEQARVAPDVKGRPVYLALACSPERTVQVKPQNLIVNLPLVTAM